MALCSPLWHGGEEGLVSCLPSPEDNAASAGIRDHHVWWHLNAMDKEEPSYRTYQRHHPLAVRTCYQQHVEYRRYTGSYAPQGKAGYLILCKYSPANILRKGKFPALKSRKKFENVNSKGAKPIYCNCCYTSGAHTDRTYGPKGTLSLAERTLAYQTPQVEDDRFLVEVVDSLDSGFTTKKQHLELRTEDLPVFWKLPKRLYEPAVDSITATNLI
ncbi:hypothetical protein UY3_03582 [Chelonia mydas]|uniref:Uncharacterized protein n=1 Tax=Chelonia mydas TaxID=8469 RepID=M7CEG0_CHEMY|nr:hypothetical protein UY3_03582 [Chelonia mydas]